VGQSSSSSPPGQSVAPLQTVHWSTQVPSPQVNWSLLHFGQPDSSSPRGQSRWPSHLLPWSTHCPPAHAIFGGKQHLNSSLPSPQCWRPSHFKDSEMQEPSPQVHSIILSQGHETSSELSMQSFSLSHWDILSIQWPSDTQVNWSGSQLLG